MTHSSMFNELVPHAILQRDDPIHSLNYAQQESVFISSGNTQPVNDISK